MGNVAHRAVLGSVFLSVTLLSVIVGAFAGLFGGEMEASANWIWNNVNEIADKWYAWFDKVGKLVGFFVTVGSGAYAIYQKLYFAEFNMHLRLKEYQEREEERLKDAKRIVGTAVQRPTPARPFDAPIFTDEHLNPVLSEINWG